MPFTSMIASLVGAIGLNTAGTLRNTVRLLPNPFARRTTLPPVPLPPSWVAAKPPRP